MSVETAKNVSAVGRSLLRECLDTEIDSSSKHSPELHAGKHHTENGTLLILDTLAHAVELVAEDETTKLPSP